MAKREFSADEAQSIGDQIGVDWKVTRLEEFRIGLAVELEHGSANPKTNVTNDDSLLTGKIAWAHLNEIPDYYTRLVAMEQQAG